MGKLANELSWSRSRKSTFDWCLRQYYWQYYGKWGGWDFDADKSAKQAYFFSKMTDLPMMLGSAVHDTIKRILEEIRDDGDVLTADPARAAREHMTEVWRAAEARRWLQNSKRYPPVFELYYGPTPEREELKGFGARAAACMETFLSSDLFRELRAEGGRNWLVVDDGPGFDESSKHRIDGMTIWALPDFARRRGAECEIWDWKTGSKSRHDESQLLSYALYARDKWGFAPDKIKLRAFYLGDGSIVEYACDADRLTGMETEIRRDFETMKSLLAEVRDNVPRDKDEAFPMTDDLDRCRRCAFREMCAR